MSMTLDFLRSLAALTVLLGHAVQLGIYRGFWPFNDSFQHGAVVVFFVLSGFLIHRSAIRSTGLKSYVIARAARVLPVASFAVCFAAVVYALLFALGVAPTNPDVYPRISVGALIVPLLFLSERFTTLRPALDPPYWSLCYEVWFYAIFGAWFFLHGPRRWIVVLATGIIAGATVLLLMPAWLLGVAASAALRRGVSLPWPRLILLLVATLFLLSVFSGTASVVWQIVASIGSMPDLQFSSYFIVDTFQAALAAIALVAIDNLWSGSSSACLAALGRPFRWLASISFTLYLLHWPVLTLLQAAGITAGDNPFAFGPILLIPIAFAALLAPTLEGRCRAVCADSLTALLGLKCRPKPMRELSEA